MEANELRIGNLVNRTNKLTKEKLQIELSASCILDISCNGVMSSYIYEPITLTEEWLLNLGFIAKSIYDDYELEGLIISSSIRIISTNERSCFNLVLSEDSIFNRRLLCVHDLQNLFFALKEEELLTTKP